MANMNSLMSKTPGIMLLLSLLIVLPAAVYAADTYPSKPLRLVVPYPAGGSSDFNARTVANNLTERLGKQVVLDFRGGGGSIIGSEMVAKADPDGYTLLSITTANTILPALVSKLPFDVVKSFAPVAKTLNSPGLLVVNASLPVTSVKELIALAKQKPNQLIFASSGIGQNAHMGTELLKILANIDVKLVHFKGVAPAVIDVLGGHSDAIISSTLSVMPHVKSGKFRVLATTGSKRTMFFPDVPTIAEAGVPGYASNQWFGILAPAGTPAPIVDRVSNEIKAALAMDDVKRQCMDAGAEPDHEGPAEFSKLINEEIARWSEVAKKADIKPE
jgi:tripartite-type tricarboxylate transporter receptor subunit TctC